jgi:small conductance mechanosensitive channel
MQPPFSPTRPAAFLLAAADPANLDLTKIDFAKLARDAVYYLIIHSPQYLMALAVMAVGFLVSRWVGGMIGRGLERQALEPPVRLLLVRISRLIFFVASAAVAMDIVGFAPSILITGIGVFGLGIGLCTQGLLSNIVAGLTIIFTKPYRVGEYVEILGVQGTVSQIDLVSTTLDHTDGSQVLIPNHKLMGEIMHNYGTTRQLDLTVGVGYSTDLKKAREVVAGILAGNPRVLKDPAPVVTIETLGDSAIILSIKPWVKLADLSPAQTELSEAVVSQFRAHSIEIPFPQREIRVLNK